MTRTDWRELITQVPREPFIPETIWVDIGAAHSQSGFTALSKHDHLQRWRELVAANEPVITQVDEGHTTAGNTGWSPSSSCSKPSIVADMLDALNLRPGHSVLEIGTGTGWNAALLCRRVGPRGRVVSIEVDPMIADGARAALAATGYSPLVITGDGTEGYPDAAPYDRVLSTAAVRESVPQAWLAQTRPGGLIVTPWGTDYCNGVLLTLHVAADHRATGRFSEDLAFMRLRAHRRRFYEPDQAQIQQAQVSTTDVHGWDFFRLINSDQAGFAIGVQVPHCALTVELHKFGEDHHLLELDDITTQSWARLDAHLTSPNPLLVHQLGPRRLWDEAVAAYDWWYEHGKPHPTRFGMTMTTHTQTVWLDNPNTVVRAFTLAG
ncbi:MAG: methyltransferase domain-containing protein [Pseudonocardiales bacterium]|nr:methyltransferase domain-containing protein [Pseudonocardiales bacterium]